MSQAKKTGAPCSGNIRNTISAVKIAAALSLSNMNVSSIEIAHMLNVTGASITKYLHKKYSAQTARLVSYILSRGLEKKVVEKALSGGSKDEILMEIERSASERKLLLMS